MMKTKLTLFVAVLAAALFGMGCASSSLNNGLVAYYPFNGNANDESGNQLHGTVQEDGFILIKMISQILHMSLKAREELIYLNPPDLNCKN